MAAFQTETDLDLGLDTPLPHDGHEVADGALAVAKPPTSKTVPAFVTKLLAMINDVSTNHLISWSENGDTFRVHNAAALAKEVLPRYYKHSNFTSLVRQLNMYGFHKVVALDTGLQSTDQQWEFVHPCVQRGRPELLVHIKRKDGGTTRAKRVTREDMDEVMSGLQTMQGTQSQLSTKFEEMQRQNQALWQEVTVLRQRHEQQRAMINKIMMFLTRLVQQPATLGNGAPASKRPRHLALQDTANAADLPTVSELDHSSPPFSNEPLTSDTTSRTGLDEEGPKSRPASSADIASTVPEMDDFSEETVRRLRPSFDHGCGVVAKGFQRLTVMVDTHPCIHPYALLHTGCVPSGRALELYTLFCPALTWHYPRL
eukprot:m.60898 g.60898  ORF g.60898 m.60898 type:complete len:371 (+) comp13866_c0_seq2:174-1286(+)